jgi:low affinity Fe/Cu permease
MTMGTFLMVFLVQNAQNRNSAAVQAKLDELIRALEPANNVFIGLEDRTIEAVHELRQEADDGLRLQDDLTATAGHHGDPREPD